MKRFKKLFLLIPLLAMIITSCNFDTSPKEKVNEENPYQLNDDEMYSILKSWDPVVTVTHDETFMPVFDGEMETVPLETQARLSSSLLDAPRDSKVGVVLQDVESDKYALNGVRYEYEKIVHSDHPSSYISVTDVNKGELDVAFYAENNRISLTLDSSFRYGEVYFVNLNDDSLMFENKDPSIRRLTIEIEDDPSDPEGTIDECEYQDNIPLLSLAHISNEDVDEHAIFSFDYDDSLPDFKEGDVFLAKEDQANSEIGLVDFYGEIVKVENNPDGSKKVFYKEPDSEKIYKKLRKKSVEPVNESDFHILVTEDSLRDQLRYSDTSRALLSFFAKESHTKDPSQLKGILEYLKFDFKFNWYDGKFTFSFSIYAGNIKIWKSEDGTKALYLTLKYEYTRISEYHIDFDVSLKKKWHVIPVGISYKVKMVEDIEESHTFYVIVDGQNVTDESEQKIKNSLIEEVGKAKNGQDNFYKKVSEDPESKKKTEGNKTTINLFEIEVPVYEPLVFKFSMDLVIEITVEAMFLVKKQWKSNRVVFNFSNKDGGDSDTHQDVRETNAWDFYLMGMAEVKVAFRLSGAFYIKGTYKFMHVEVYAEFYVKVGIQGTISITYMKKGADDKVDGNTSIDLYVLMGAKVGLDITFAVLHLDFSYDLFKTYILRIYFSNELETYTSGEQGAVTEINLNRTVASINDFNILEFSVWDGVRMSVAPKKFDADARFTYIEGWLGDMSFKMFSFESHDDRVTISDDGEIRIADGTAAEFDATFTVKVSKLAGSVDDRDITIHFSAPDAHHIYLDYEGDGTNIIDLGKYRPGYEYKLMLPGSRSGYTFVSYTVHFPDNYDAEMHPTDVITMPEGQDLYITANWHKIQYYTVYFYDGHNNLVHVDNHVEEHTAAIAPTEEIRDQYMDGYFFIGWDKAFTSVESDLIVRGIYIKVGD